MSDEDLNELRERFKNARERAERTAAEAGPNSYGAGYDLGYSDALGEFLEFLTEQRP
jgi:hypothetical protein